MYRDGGGGKDATGDHGPSRSEKVKVMILRRINEIQVRVYKVPLGKGRNPIFPEYPTECKSNRKPVVPLAVA